MCVPSDKTVGNHGKSSPAPCSNAANSSQVDKNPVPNIISFVLSKEGENENKQNLQ